MALSPVQLRSGVGPEKPDPNGVPLQLGLPHAVCPTIPYRKGRAGEGHPWTALGPTPGNASFMKVQYRYINRGWVATFRSASSSPLQETPLLY